jgi:hypothetical protein
LHCLPITPFPIPLITPASDQNSFNVQDLANLTSSDENVLHDE